MNLYTGLWRGILVPFDWIRILWGRFLTFWFRPMDPLPLRIFTSNAVNSFTVPTGQCDGVVQSEHDESPASLPSVPNLQVSHAAANPFLLNVPTGHCSH